MKLRTDGDHFGIETDPHDADLARATAALVADGKALAEALGVLGTGTCENCGEDKRVRPFPLVNDAGEVWAAALCADCQRGRVEESLAQAEANAEAEGEEVGVDA